MGLSLLLTERHTHPAPLEREQQPANSLSRSHEAGSLGDRNLVVGRQALQGSCREMSLVGNDAKCHNGEDVYKHSSPQSAKEQALCATSSSFPGGQFGPGSSAPLGICSGGA